MKTVLPVVLVIVFGAILVSQFRLAKRGQAARAANGGRHTNSWWISVAIVIVGSAVIAAVH